MLPKGFSVCADPTVKSLAGQDLLGHYTFDNEGIRARRVTVIDDGVLKSFLMSRSPIDGFAQSNGHGRKDVGGRASAIPSNFLVEAVSPLTSAALKQRFVDELKATNKPYGLSFEDMRRVAYRRGLIPVLIDAEKVYRVYPDGHQERVRGGRIHLTRAMLRTAC